MTVKELIEKLQDYGDYLEVMVLTNEERGIRHDVASVDTENGPEGETVVVIWPDK